MTLAEFGLTAQEEAVYQALVSVPSATVAELAAAVSASPTDTAAALDALTGRGLVSRQPDGGYASAPPAVALGAELAARRESLHRAELAVAELVESYRTGTMGRAQRELLEIVSGRDAVSRRYVQLQLSARHSIDVLVTGSARVVKEDNTEESTAMARGLKARAVIDRTFLSEPRAVDNIDESLQRGIRVRTTEEIPLKLIVCDNEVAMLPLHGGDAGADPSLVLRGGLVNLARALFDSLWEHARPYGEPLHGIDGLDTRILRLLLAGLTDKAVAAQLELSTRTVQRRIQALMRRSGASARIQLGWYARHHGWV